MSVFTQIEERLTQFAAEHHTVVTRDRENHWPNYPTLGFEERRIDWQRAGINLAVIIQPTFEMTGVDSERWNFRLVAWQWRERGNHAAGKELLERVPFQEIEKQIEPLLLEAKVYLNSIRAKDLKSPRY